MTVDNPIKKELEKYLIPYQPRKIVSGKIVREQVEPMITLRALKAICFGWAYDDMGNLHDAIEKILKETELQEKVK